MKINKLFHWLYFTVMMLPIFILPIFALAVRSDNNFEPISIQVEENEVINFNQLVFDDNVDGSFTTNGTLYQTYYVQNVQLVYGHKYVTRIDIKASQNFAIWFRLGAQNKVQYVFDLNNISTDMNRFSFSNTLVYDGGTSVNELYFMAKNNTSNVLVEFENLNLFDLTQMFGEGNEPSLNDFNLLFTEQSYSHTLSTQRVLTNQLVTYSDTDFGSQTVYTLYQGVNKYFNYDDVFNFGDLYTWLEANFFSGNAPLGFFIFWHLLIYWLLTSILWLIFDVLMYVPQLVHRWLDKASLS